MYGKVWTGEWISSVVFYTSYALFGGEVFWGTSIGSLRAADAGGHGARSAALSGVRSRMCARGVF
ncbi:MAG: hypothetical protein ACJAZ9_000799 [Neolewinella sp.]|jgi:hypothetical protein